MIPTPIYRKGTTSDNGITPITIMAVDTVGLEKSGALLEVYLIPDQQNLLDRKSLT